MLHLFVLSALAVAHPVLEVLGAAPAHFVARRADGLAASVLLLAVMLVPPAACTAALVLVGRVAPSRRTATMLGLVALLFANLCLAPLRRADVPLPVPLALAAGATFAAAYRAMPRVRELFTFLAPALLIVPAVFVTSLAGEDLFRPGAMIRRGPDLRAGPAARVERPLPVIMLVFDELPLGLLLDGGGQINQQRFPGFARLASLSTWYRDATGTSASTVLAIPSLLTGRRVERFQAPTFENHPDNLFNLLSRTHRLDLIEYWSDLRPRAGRRTQEGSSGSGARALLLDAASLSLRAWLPTATGPAIQPGLRDQLLPIAWREAHEDAPRLFDRFLEGLGDEQDPGLHYCHLMLPHSPHERLPSGQRYTREARNLADGEPPASPDEAARQLQRAALQAGYADSMVQRLLLRLRASGLLDRAVLVVTADHGIAFQAGARHRVATASSLDELASVPLFIRAPGAPVGQVNDAPVELLDVFPTVADLLGAVPGWQVEGRPAQEIVADGPRRRSMTNGDQAPLEITDRMLGLRAARRFAAAIGSGPWHEVWMVGPRPDLLGQVIAASPTRAADALQVRWRSEGDLTSVDPAADFLPALVTVAPASPAQATVVVTVNGVASASVRFGPGEPSAVQVLLPPEYLRAGRNELGFLEVDPSHPGAYRSLPSVQVAR